MTESPLQVKLEAFEGPLDLLLHLIREQKIDIYDIPITLITEQYLEYLRIMKELDLDVAGEFLVMAATLLYIKSKMLLPVEGPDDEDDEGLDPRDELVKKLLEYQSFKEAAKELGLLAKERSKVFTRSISEHFMHEISLQEEADTFEASLFDLLKAFSRVFKEKKTVGFHEVYEEVITIEQKTTEIRRMLAEHDAVSFEQLLRKQTTRNELIVTFLAILELSRKGDVNVSQDSTFGTIVLTKTKEMEGRE